jgi:DNA modification methylase
MDERKLKKTTIADLVPDNLNANKGTEYGQHLIEKSLRELGAGRSILLDKNNRIIAGNKTVENAASIGLEDVLIVETDGKQIVAVKRIDIDLDTEQGRKMAIADNSTSKANLAWDNDAIQQISEQWNVKPEDWGIDCLEESDGSGVGDTTEGSKLEDRFIVPPFSILDTRKGYWQERKRMWRHTIGDYGESRNDTLIQSPELKYKDLYQKSMKKRKELGISFNEYIEKFVSKEELARLDQTVLSQGVSILDPVLSEIIVRWFGLENGKSFDCFAGDTVFGFVSSKLGQHFTGIELRQQQVELNNQRVTEAGLTAAYICDDGQNVGKHIELESQDLFFSCPPYYDLEHYSDLPNDASNQHTFTDFVKILETAFKDSLKCLKNNRFAVIVVGDVRDKKNGFYYDMISEVKRIFRLNGAMLYNEMILIETGASTALRAEKYMESRKVAKMHQNVLVFYKGNPKDIKNNFKKIEYKEEDFENESENLEHKWVD